MKHLERIPVVGLLICSCALNLFLSIQLRQLMERTPQSEGGQSRILAQSLIPSLLAAPLRRGPGTEKNSVAIIVHPLVPVDDLKFNTLREILSGSREYWTQGLRVTLVSRPPTAEEQDVILKVVFGMTEDSYRQYWLSKVSSYQTTGKGPRVEYSTQMNTDLVSSIPGAVSFVDATRVPQNVKVLRIDGHLPEEEGYPLR